MIRRAYKLFKLRKDGTLGSLFLNRRAIVPMDTWLDAEDHHKAGFKHRPGWHCLPEPVAHHLSKKGRVWCEVVIKRYTEETRPLHQGRLWFLAQKMKVVRRLDANQDTQTQDQT